MKITENSAICALLFVIFILNDVQITIFDVKITPTKIYLCRFNGVLLIFSFLFCTATHGSTQKDNLLANCMHGC
jgi:hypothetical protein